MNSHRKVESKDANRPTLRKSPGGSTKPVEGDGKDQDSKQGSSDADERPTLKRRQ
jgi:hypothetical protein